MQDPLTASLSDLQPFQGFEQAAETALEFLQNTYGFGLWMITRTVENDWIILKSRNHSYSVSDGDVLRWSDSFCYRMVQNDAPRIAPQSDLYAPYAAAPIGKEIPIKAYVGYPLVKADGSLFGTLCGIDPNAQSEELVGDDPLFQLLARFLSTVLAQELASLQLQGRITQLEDKAFRDPMTGLLNKGSWISLVEQQEDKCRRYGEPAAVIIVDLDDLKRINDKQGHEAGDSYILRAAGTLEGVARASDLVARLGGNEFGILLEGDTALDPEPLVRRITAAFETTGISASIGWARRRSDETLQSTINTADERMYEDKRRRKG